MTPVAAIAVRRRARATPMKLPSAGDPRQPLPIPLPAPPPKDQRGLRTPIVEGPQHLFHDPPPLPSVQDRIRLVLADIDLSAPAIVIWVPGSSEYWIKQRFLDELHADLPRADVTMIPYEATWRFSHSVPDGAAVLSGVLAELRRRAPGRPVLLAGESQGAWVISTVLQDPAAAAQVTRTSIWGHPAAAPQEFGRPGTVRETNSPSDIVTIPLGPDPGRVIQGVEALSSKHFATGLAILGSYAVQRPDMVVKLLRAISFAIPVIGGEQRNAHDYDDDLGNGVAFLLAGLSPATRRRLGARSGLRSAG